MKTSSRRYVGKLRLQNNKNILLRMRIGYANESLSQLVWKWISG